MSVLLSEVMGTTRYTMVGKESMLSTTKQVLLHHLGIIILLATPIDTLLSHYMNRLGSKIIGSPLEH